MSGSSATPSAGPGATPAALVTDVQNNRGGIPYSVELISASGQLLASANPTIPTLVPVRKPGCPQFQPGDPRACPPGYRPWAPLVSSSNTKAYFLDGDDTIKYLTPAGATGTAMTLPADPHTRYAFSVDPTDTRIAVAAFIYASGGTYPEPKFLDQIFVEDLGTGANRVNLLTSSTAAEYPVGWNGGHVILGVGDNQPSQFVSPNPYWAWSGFKVVDATNGSLIATISPFSGACGFGPLVAAGSACGALIGFDDFSGAYTEIGAQPTCGGSSRPCSSSIYGSPVLSPDGTRVAVGLSSPTEVWLLSTSGAAATGASGAAVGWLDSDHLVFSGLDNMLHVLTISTGSTLTMASSTNYTFVGTVPQQIG